MSFEHCPGAGAKEIQEETASAEECAAPSQALSQSAGAVRQSGVRIMVTVNDGGYVIGQDHPNARYNDEDVERVQMLRAEGYAYSAISRMMDMPVRTIRGYLDGSRRCQSVAGWKKVYRRWDYA